LPPVPTAESSGDCWWIRVDRTGTNDGQTNGFQAPFYGQEFGNWLNSDEFPAPGWGREANGFNNTDGYMPMWTDLGVITELSAAENGIGSTSGPALLAISLEWRAYNGGPATTNPPATVTISIDSRVQATLLTNGGHTDEDSHADYLAAIANPVTSSYTYLDNGFNDTVDIQNNMGQLDVIKEGTHQEQLTGNNGTASYDLYVEGHSWATGTMENGMNHNLEVDVGVTIVP
jgi:hypothetical protein